MILFVFFQFFFSLTTSQVNITNWLGYKSHDFSQGHVKYSDNICKLNKFFINILIYILKSQFYAKLYNKFLV